MILGENSMLTRRDLLQLAPMVATAHAFAQATPLVNSLRNDQKTISMDLPEQYPAYASDLIRTIITVAHFDLDKLKGLIGPHPQLVKSAWDWGFGDWETPLGAACHMGRHDIAEYLLLNGAIPTLFSWVLFGDLRMVEQISERQPGIQRVGGPHSISLLAHARMGGKQSEKVLEYLTSLKDADGAKPVPLTEEEKASICGSYRLGTAPSQLVDVTSDMLSYQNNPMYTYAPQLNWTRHGTVGRPLFHVGNKVFYPAGAPSVEILFKFDSGGEVMILRDGDSVELIAPRVASS
jgi:hypothetical protein